MYSYAIKRIFNQLVESIKREIGFIRFKKELNRKATMKAFREVCHA